MNRGQDGNPPERRPLGLQSIYRLFGSVRHFRGEHTGMVFPYQIK
jgi:hypothetical protein